MERFKQRHKAINKSYAQYLLEGDTISAFELAKGAGGYLLQLEKGERRKTRDFLFSTSLPLANSVKAGVGKTLSRLSSLGYRDFPDRSLYTAATYLLRQPGKMLRPALVFLGAKIIGEDTDSFVDMAAAIEMLHTASLVHDDVIDNESVRRGIASTHVKFGEGAAILSGDALIAKAVALAARYGPKAVEFAANSSLKMCAGELLDYSCQQRKRLPSLSEYLRIARLKSGASVAMCCSIAARLRADRLEKELYGFGLNLGVAFQIKDDIIEMIEAEKMKKTAEVLKASEFAPNLVKMFEGQLGAGNGEALERSVSLNNYFADSALGSIKDQKTRKELTSYVNFVRISLG